MARQPTLSREEKRAILSKLPAFIDPVPGFKFVWDNSVVIVIGWGGWRKWEHKGNVSYNDGKDSFNATIGELHFKKAGLLGVYAYKGEWFMCDISELDGIEEAQTWQDYMNDYTMDVTLTNGNRLHGADMI